jgi:hypothetical protein
MSPLLAILRLCTEQYAHLSEDEIRTLLSVAVSNNTPMRAKREPAEASTNGIRRTVLKPVLVRGSTFRRNGKTIVRKPHRRAKPA